MLIGKCNNCITSIAHLSLPFGQAFSRDHLQANPELPYHLLETTFDVSLNLTDYEWDDDFYNTSSQAYMDLTDQMIQQVKHFSKPVITHHYFYQSRDYIHH